MHGEAIV